MSASILDFDYTELDEVVSYALNIQEKVSKDDSNLLKGLVFCITGKVHTVKNRDELKGLIESAGGKVVGSVSKNVNYLQKHISFLHFSAQNTYSQYCISVT